MEDLQYIFNLGFSGSDVWRAVLLSFFGAMILNKNGSVWILGGWALAIDRVIWPVTAQALAGADIHSIYASIGALFETLPDDLGLYLVRYLGIVGMIGAFFLAKLRIHKPFMQAA